MMTSNDIKRVWGMADAIPLTFKYSGNNRWNVTVPADTEDGIYAVEIFAESYDNTVGHWTGWLFMCNGVCHLNFNVDYRFSGFSTNFLFFCSKLDSYNTKHVKCEHK